MFTAPVKTDDRQQTDKTCYSADQGIPLKTCHLNFSLFLKVRISRTAYRKITDNSKKTKVRKPIQPFALLSIKAAINAPALINIRNSEIPDVTVSKKSHLVNFIVSPKNHGDTMPFDGELNPREGL